MKDVRVVFMNYLAGTPIKVKGVRVTSDGIPTILGDLIQSVRNGSIPDLRLINTILFCTRSLNLGSDVDTSSITEPPIKGLLIYDNYINAF